MMEHPRLEQIREFLRLTGQEDSLIDESMGSLSTPEDFLRLLRKVRDSLDMSIKMIEENQKRMNL